MSITDNDTIVAPATPPGRGGIGIIRISGKKVQHIAQAMIGQLPKPRYAHFTAFHTSHGELIDQGLALYFPAPHSFTGEDVLELHAHGGRIILEALVQAAVQSGARLARPGEFSERAFLNNKIDLAQAEAIADLIDANSKQAARGALRSLQGEFSKKIQEILEKLIRLRMFVEAAIDFPEEEIDFIQQEKVFTQITALLTQLQSIQQTAKQGALLREGIRVVIAGQPNVGKSSLLNALSGKEIAIVTDIAGTTRDVLRQEINLDGLPLHIIDTAGLRESNDPVEQEGIRRARQEIQQADQLIVIVDAAQTKNINITELVASLQLPVDLNRQIMLIRNKIDLTAELPEIAKHQSYTVINLSVKTQQGLDLLRNQLKNNCGFAPATESQFLARRRHIDAIQRAEQSLQNATQQKATELIAEELRQAQQALGEITGEFTSDALLGRIFSEFCIGK